MYTVGHSTRSLRDFLQLLQAHNVDILADVRTIPKSRRHPHFAGDALSAALTYAGLRYVHLPGLGGLRRARPDSLNAGWSNASFRGYADHMASEAFATGLETLLSLTDEGGVAVMCAEAVPWRCHRSLIADALLVRGLSVEHILSPRATQPHHLTPFASVDGLHITYPGRTL